MMSSPNFLEQGQSYGTLEKHLESSFADAHMWHWPTSLSSRQGMDLLGMPCLNQWSPHRASTSHFSSSPPLCWLASSEKNISLIATTRFNFTTTVLPKPWPPSQRRTWEASYKETSSASMGSLEPWSQIMGNSLTTTPSRIFARSWVSRTTTPHSPTLKPMDKLRSRIDPCLKSSRLDSRG